MNTVPHSATTQQQCNNCPSDDALMELLSERTSNIDQSKLIQRLDECPGCRTRLQAIAGSDEIWSAAIQGLSAETTNSPALARVTESLRSANATTQAAGISPPNVNEFDFLEPCNTPNRIGRIDQYEIIELLGHGGMGVVFKAFEPELTRVVALKVLAAPTAQEAKARQRFQREARAAAAVRSEHVVAVHAVKADAPMPYLVMEHIEGQSLDEYIRESPELSWSEVIRIGTEIADGLHAAHSARLVHRDIKPANILLERTTNRVKITDFGLARAIDDTQLTQDGYVAGTPEFMAPEQSTGGNITHAADLFSLGSVLYTMCTGQPPFVAESSLAVLRQIQDDQPTPIEAIRNDVPADLVNIIDRLMHKMPESRYATAAEVSQALQAIDCSKSTPMKATDTRPSRSKMRILLGSTLLILIAAGAGLVASEITGVSRFMANALAIEDTDDKADEDANKDEAVDVPRDGVVQQAQRIQIVTPESLMREQIQLEKDQIPETQSPFLVRKFSGHTGPVKGVAFSPDGKFVVSGSGWPRGDRTLRLWDVALGKEVKQFDMAGIPLHPDRCGPRESPGEIMCVDFAPDGKHVVAGLAGGAVGLWDVNNGKLVRHFEGHKSTINDVAFSPVGQQILTASRDSTARLWDAATGDELLRIPNQKAWMRCVAFSPDGQQALLGSYDKKLRLWDLQNATMLAETTLSGWVWDVSFSPNGRFGVAVAGSLITIWNLDDPQKTRTIKHPGNVSCVAYSPDGSRLISGGYDTTLQLWDAATGKQLESYEGHRGWVWSIAVSPDGRYALSGGGGRRTPNQGTNAGIDFDMRLWEMPKRETRVVQPTPSRK